MTDNRFAAARPDFARCRALRHAWEPAGEVEVKQIKLLALQCSSCGTLRYDRWNTRTGERWGTSSYVWPDGYRDRDPGHDGDWWRVTYAEHLYSTGVLQDAPTRSTRKRRKAG